MPSLHTKIEAILYLRGQPVPLSEIAEAASCPEDTAQDALINLMQEYARRDTALEVVETPAGYSLQLRESYRSLLGQMMPSTLGVGALRTLALVALRNPIRQVDVVEIRGSGAYQHIQELVEQGFVRKTKATDGRSYLLRLTDKFHQYFEIDESSKLPHLLAKPEAIPPAVAPQSKPSGEL